MEDEARICSLIEDAFSTAVSRSYLINSGDGCADDEPAARVAGGNRGSQSSTCASRKPFATMSALTASRVSRPQAAMAWSAAASNSNGAGRDGSRSRFTNPSLPKYGHFIPARDGAGRGLMLLIHSLKSNGTGPASRRLRDETGGVAPAGPSPDLAALRRSTDAYGRS